MLQTFRSRAALAAAVFALAAGAAVAAGPSGADTAKSRVQNMKALGGAMKGVIDQVRSGSPDAAVVKANAAKVAAYGAAIPSWFPRGSGPETGVKMRALPAIWTDWSGFTAAQTGFVAEANRLNAAAAAGDMAAVGAQLPKVGAACKTCHDKFRGPEIPGA